MFLILSFVLRSTRRSALILIALLITAWGLMYMTRHAAPHYEPPLSKIRIPLGFEYYIFKFSMNYFVLVSNRKWIVLFLILLL